MQRDKDWEAKVRPKLQENFGRSQRRLDDFNAKSASLRTSREGSQYSSNDRHGR